MILSRKRSRPINYETNCTEVDYSSDTAECGRQMDEVDAKKLLKNLKSEPSLDWEFLGRTTEFKEISEYLKKCVINKRSGIIYISGSPGTGKTCTLNRILTLFEKNSVEKLGFARPKDYKVIRINASKIASYNGKNSSFLSGNDLLLHLSKLTKLQTQIIDKLKKINKEVGLREGICNFIKEIEKKRSKYVMFIDEIDLIKKNRRGDDLILELSRAIINSPKSGLVLATISNTVKIGNDIAKRLSLNITMDEKIKLIVFSPYDHNMLKDIVLQRIEKANDSSEESIMNKTGIELCVRKVASIYGDCRRTLDACYLTLGKYLIEYQNGNFEQIGESDSITECSSSIISTRENTPIRESPTIVANRNVVPIGVRTRSLPNNLTVPIGNFQNVISRIHHSNQGKLEVIRALPLHQQYAIMGIVLAMVDDYYKRHESNSVNGEINKFSFSDLTNTRISPCLSRKKYHEICKEFMTVPEDYKDMLDALEANNIISTGENELVRKSSYRRGASRIKRDPVLELAFPPEQVLNALISLPKLGQIFSNLIPNENPN
ncbi:cell division control protein 6 [Cryptosporidium felis]|nr:cell division control protein 6 [Cryptosporidium felis]